MLDTDLYRRLAEKPGNLCFSPYSIAAALSMVQSGAGGATRSELEKLLGPKDFGALGHELATRAEATEHQIRQLEWMPGATKDVFGCHLTVANALWRQKGYPLAPGYLDAMKGVSAELGEADFQQAPDRAVEAINAWVAKATRDKIKQVLSRIDPLTRVILANAIYFKARWADEFYEGGTRPAPFFLLDGKKIDVPTMHSLGHRRTAREGALHLLSLPYVNEKLAMLVLLPDKGALGQVEKELDDAAIERLLGKMKHETTEVSLPKFRVESSFELKDSLQAVGLATAFGPGADFTRLSPEPGFALSEVLHKTYIDVDEKGTEAAAVTVPMAAGSGPPKKNVEFKADRPFLFLIRDLPTKTTLFLGRVVDPR